MDINVVPTNSRANHVFCDSFTEAGSPPRQLTLLYYTTIMCDVHVSLSYLQVICVHCIG